MRTNADELEDRLRNEANRLPAEMWRQGLFMTFESAVRDSEQAPGNDSVPHQISAMSGHVEELKVRYSHLRTVTADGPVEMLVLQRLFEEALELWELAFDHLDSANRLEDIEWEQALDTASDASRLLWIVQQYGSGFARSA